MSPFFSVVIPVFNRAALLRRAITSLERQEFRDFELIVVDDGSSDGSAEAAEESSLRPQVLRQQNAGPGPARNLGIGAACGEYVAFLDSDDLWFPWTLRCYRDAIEKHSAPPCLFGAITRFADESELETVRDEPLRTTEFRDYLATAGDLRVFQGTGVAALRRDAIAKTGGFHEERAFCEDLDFLLRMGTDGPVVQLEAPLMIALRSHETSSGSDLGRTFDGTALLLRQEARGAYPGGGERRGERRTLLLKHTIAVLQQCIVRGENGRAWAIYRRIAPWLLERGERAFCLDLGKSIARNFYRATFRAAR